jgi:hypothetical protein
MPNTSDSIPATATKIEINLALTLAGRRAGRSALAVICHSASRS